MKGIVGIIILILVLAGGYFLITEAPTEAEAYGLTLEANIDPLDEGVYEVWVKFGADTVLLGEIEGGKGKYEFDTEETSILDATEVLVTIRPDEMFATAEVVSNEEEEAEEGEVSEEMEEGAEEVGEVDQQKTDVNDLPRIVVLSGDVLEDGTVELSFPLDFTGSEGTFILATPTNGSDTNETSGIWFLSLGDEGPEVGLTLPALIDGWVYEGWVVVDGTPLTSGRFDNVAAADFFDGFSGEEAGPSFPGEDYLENAPEGFEFPLELADGNTAAVISVEPDVDGIDPTGEAPFQVKVLLSEIAEGAVDHGNIALTLDTTSVPRGTAMVR